MRLAFYRYAPYTLSLHRRPKYMTDALVLRLDNELRALDPARLQQVAVVSRQLRALIDFHEAAAGGSDGGAPDLDDTSGLRLAVAEVEPGQFQSTQIAAFLGVDVASGVDSPTLVRNLTALYVAINGMLGRLSLVHGARNHVDASWTFLHNLLWAWLLCMGAEKWQVKQWLSHLFPWRDAVKVDVESALRIRTDHTKPSFMPFQSYIEVSACARSRSCHVMSSHAGALVVARRQVGERGDSLVDGLFDNTQDGASLTLQLFNSLVPTEVSRETIPPLLGGEFTIEMCDVAGVELAQRCPHRQPPDCDIT